MQKPKVVFIDWDGTLCTDRFWQHLNVDNPKLFSKIQNYLFVESRDLVGSWMIGGVTSEQISKKTAKAITADSDTIFKELKKSCESMKLIDSKFLKMIKEIRKSGLKVVLSTDNMDTFTRWTVPALKLYKYFDEILNSFDLKARKKDFNGKKSLFFDNYLSSTNASPSECVVIDDAEPGRLLEHGFVYKQIERGIGLTSELNQIIQLL